MDFVLREDKWNEETLSVLLGLHKKKKKVKTC